MTVVGTGAVLDSGIAFGWVQDISNALSAQQLMRALNAPRFSNMRSIYLKRRRERKGDRENYGVSANAMDGNDRVPRGVIHGRTLRNSISDSRGYAR